MSPAPRAANPGRRDDRASSSDRRPDRPLPSTRRRWTTLFEVTGRARYPDLGGQAPGLRLGTGPDGPWRYPASGWQPMIMVSAETKRSGKPW